MRFDRLIILPTVLVVMGYAGAAVQQPVVYPAKGQSAQMQARDGGECQAWAKQTTGVDPVAVAYAPLPPSQPAVGGGERLVGAARGAAGGAVIGAIAGNAGKGAGIGAVVGTMAGGRQARHNQAAQQNAAQGQKDQALDTFNRAFAACMDARGYTIR
jgi:hypothetical protein